METLQEKEVQGRDLLIALRNKVLALVSQSESEELLAEAMAILSGRSLPCAYSHERTGNERDHQRAAYGNRIFRAGEKIQGKEDRDRIRGSGQMDAGRRIRGFP